MNHSLCRVCLRVISEGEFKPFDKDVSLKIRSCLRINLMKNKAYPSQICSGCVYKIEQINDFCVAIKYNQEMLLQHLQNGSLSSYYLILSSQVCVKEENKIADSNENFEVKDSIFKEEINKANVYSSSYAVESCLENKSNEMLNETELIKDKELIKSNDFNEPESLDDDNLKLSSFKDEIDYNSESIHENQEECNINVKEKPNIGSKVLDDFNCVTCDKVCNTHDNLKAHYKDEHAKENEAVETTFTEQNCNGNVMYKCDKCAKVYPKKYMKRHMLYHSNERPYVCKLCARTYKTVSDIMRHGFRAHSGVRLQCSYNCGFSTAYTGALKEHEDRVHKHVYKYTCEKCGKGFQVKTWYVQHQNIHNGLKPFVCDICGVAFHMDKYLTTHRSSMHPQSLDKKRLICLHCDLKCDSVNSLALHLENEHNVPRSKTKSQKASLCDYCGKILNRPEQLKIHRKMHLGEKPYRCRKFSLHVHERTHSRARPYTCVPCGTRYSQPSALYRHQRLHHGLPRKRA